MDSIENTKNQNIIIKSKNKNNKLRLNLRLKKNISSLTTTTSSIKTSKINNNTKIFSLFKENNTFHYQLPFEQNNTKNFTIFSDRKYKRKILMDSIETYCKRTKFKSKDYNNHITNLMSKYLYSNPEAETINIPKYEITKSKINFYKRNKEYIKNYFAKSKSTNKYNLHNLNINQKLGYNEENNSTTIRTKNIKYQDPIDSLGLLLRNKIVHDKILLNYQDKEVKKYGKSINKIKILNSLEKYKKKIKINSKVQTILDNDFINYNYLGFNSKNFELFEEAEVNDNNNNYNLIKKELSKIFFIEINDFLKGSVYLLCGFFRPAKIFPETREEFCMDYDPLSNCIYLFSGSSCNIDSDQIWKFNNNNYTWTNLKSNNYIAEPRRGHSGLFYKNKYYIFGGQFLHSKLFAQLDIYNFETNTWINGNLNFLFFKLRRNHICCQIGPQMFIHGGIDENGEVLDDSYLLTLNNLNWNKASVMLILIPPKLSYHSCCLVISSKLLNNQRFSIYSIPDLSEKELNSRIKEKGLYVFGGKNTNICNDMWLLKIGKKPLEWIKVSSFGKSPCPRYLCSMNFFEKGNFIIIHGGKTKINGDKFALNDTYLFELYRYEWIRVDYGEKEKIVRPRCSHCSVICRNKLFIFGGINEQTFNGSSFFIINLDINKAKEDLIINNKNYNKFKRYDSIESIQSNDNNINKNRQKQANNRKFKTYDKFEKNIEKK